MPYKLNTNDELNYVHLIYYGSVDLEDKKLILLKPWQYMNRSGQAIATAMGFYRVPLSQLLVVVDDMALAPGRIRLRGAG